MLIEALGLVAMLAAPPEWPDWRAWAPAWPAPAYRPASRAVDNWRWQAVASLDLPAEKAVRLAAGGEPGGVTRCVRLNNYWCVKRAGWAGEIAADAEGHVAFASALEGASVAALLLRRYYLDFGRKSALAIVSRWAPAQCGGPAAARGGRKGASALRAVAPRGIGGTLRARWLAAHGRGGKAMKSGARPRRSVVADRPIPMLRAPAIAPGMGERAPLALRLTGPTLPQALAGAEPKAPSAAACPAEQQRIRNYAQNAIRGLTESVDEDLKLFEPDGAPTERLARLLENMSAVEIGPLRADAALVAAAVKAVRAAPLRKP